MVFWYQCARMYTWPRVAVSWLSGQRSRATVARARMVDTGGNLSSRQGKVLGDCNLTVARGNVQHGHARRKLVDWGEIGGDICQFLGR